MQIMIQYSKKDFEQVKEYFPGLNYSPDDQKIMGELVISPCRYHKDPNNIQLSEWKIVPCASNCDDYIEGRYLIQIDFHQIDPQGYPKVYEIGDRIESLAKQLNKKLVDLHLNHDKSCCLGIFFEPINSLSQFILSYVYPYFVWQAYYAKYKKIPPCGEYSHGKTGRQEAVQEYKQNIVALNKIGRNEQCPCKSGKKYKKCCLRKDEAKKLHLNNFCRNWNKILKK